VQYNIAIQDLLSSLTKYHAYIGTHDKYTIFGNHKEKVLMEYIHTSVSISNESINRTNTRSISPENVDNGYAVRLVKEYTKVLPLYR